MDNIPAEVQSQVNNIWECQDYGGEWIVYDNNFDNIGQGIKSQFVIMTSEGWLDIYHNSLDNNRPY